MQTHKFTRWQLRVNKELEILIRKHAESEHRSINQTLILILEKYYYPERDNQSNKSILKPD